MNSKLLGVFLLLLGVIGLPFAWNDFQQTRTTQKPQTISWAQLEADMPDEGWFEITGAQLETTEALYVDEGGKIGNIYIPARKAGSEIGSDQPISVLVKVEDAKIRTFLEQLKAEDKSASAAEKLMLANIDKLQIRRTLRGTIAEGVDALDDKDKGAIKRSDAKLADGFVILQEGATPSVSGRFFMLLLGAALTGGGLLLIVKKTRKL